jgi:pimeloyl-ACP methyl ester carboxylesterase
MAPLATRTWPAAGGTQPSRRAPLAVLLHGITSSSATWWRVGPALAERGFDTVAPDLRGHGASPRGTPGIGLEELAADVADTVSGLRAGPALAGNGPRVDLAVGHSLGALVLLTLLGADPRFARFVVLEDPPAQAAIDWEELVDQVERDARRARADPGGLRAELLAPPSNLEPVEADIRLESLAALDVRATIAGLRRGLAFDLAGLAAAVQAPALLFMGTEELGSLMVGPARAAAATALPRGWTEVLACGHTIHREAFESYMRRLDAWLERVGARAAPERQG